MRNPPGEMKKGNRDYPIQIANIAHESIREAQYNRFSQMMACVGATVIMVMTPQTVRKYTLTIV